MSWIVKDLRWHFREAVACKRTAEQNMRKIAKDYVKVAAPAKTGQFVEVKEGRRAGRYVVLEAKPYGLGCDNLAWCLRCSPLTKDGRIHRGRGEVLLHKDHKPRRIKPVFTEKPA